MSRLVLPTKKTEVLSEASFQDPSTEDHDEIHPVDDEATPTAAQAASSTSATTITTTSTSNASLEEPWKPHLNYNLYEPQIQSNDSGFKCYFAGLSEALGQQLNSKDVRKAINRKLGEPTFDTSQWTSKHFQAAVDEYMVPILLLYPDSPEIQFEAFKPTVAKSDKKIVIIQRATGHCALASSSTANQLHSLTLTNSSLGDLLRTSFEPNESKSDDISKFHIHEDSLESIDISLLQPLIELYEKSKQEKKSNNFDFKKYQSNILGHASVILKMLKHLADLGLLKQGDVAELKIAGGQSSGKSRLLSKLVGIPVGFSASGTCTCSPIVYSIIWNPELEGNLKINVKADMPNCEPFDEDAQSLEEVSRMVSQITASLKKTIVHNPINVTIETDKRGSMCLVDYPGLVSSQSMGISNELRNINEKVIKDVRCNPKSTLILANRNDNLEAANILWGDIIKKQGITKKLIEDQFIIVLTHAVEMLEDGQKNDRFKGCKSWEDFEAALRSPFKYDLHNANFRFFLTAVNASWNTEKMNKEIKKSNFKEVLKKYNQDDAAANTKLIELIEEIGKDFYDKNNSAKEEFIRRCVGYEALAKHVRERFFTTMKEGYEPVPKMIEKRRKEKFNKLNNLIKQSAEIGDVRLDDLVDAFFEVFAVLYAVVTDGSSIESQGGAPFGKPTKFIWLENSHLINAFMSKFKDLSENLESVIDFCKTRLPDANTNPLPDYPFVVDENDAKCHSTPLDEFNQQLENRFVKRYNESLASTPAGHNEAEILIIEMVARIVNQRPGLFTKKDLIASTDTDSNTVSYMPSIKVKLNYNFGIAFGDLVPKYVAKRFASLFWRRALFVKDFMSQLEQFNILFSSPQLMALIDEVLVDNYYTDILKDVKDSLSESFTSMNNQVDIHSCQMIELYSSIIPLNSDFIRAYMAMNPLTPVTDCFNDAMSGGSSNSTQSLIKTAATKAMDALVKSSPVAQCLSEVAKFPSMPSPSPMKPAELELRLREFFDGIWSSKRMAGYEQCSDTVIAMMSLNQTQDVMPPPTRKNEATEVEVKIANNILHRLYSARKCNFVDALRCKLSQIVTKSKNSNKKGYASSVLMNSFEKKVMEYTATTGDKANEKVDLAVILRDKFQLTSPGDELKKKLETTKQELESLEKAKAALDWYFDELNSIDKEKLDEFYDLDL